MTECDDEGTSSDGVRVVRNRVEDKMGEGKKGKGEEKNHRTANRKGEQSRELKVQIDRQMGICPMKVSKCFEFQNGYM